MVLSSCGKHPRCHCGTCNARRSNSARSLPDGLPRFARNDWGAVPLNGLPRFLTKPGITARGSVFHSHPLLFLVSLGYGIYRNGPQVASEFLQGSCRTGTYRKDDRERHSRGPSAPRFSFHGDPRRRQDDLRAHPRPHAQLHRRRSARPVRRMPELQGHRKRPPDGRDRNRCGEQHRRR